MTDHIPILIVPARPSPGAISVPVLKIFDGDGFLTRLTPPDAENDLFGNTEIEVVARFGSIDAPELEQPGGHEARAFLASLIGGREVIIDILMKSDTGRIVDRYGRIVCVPYVKQAYEECELAAPPNQRHRAHFSGQSFVITRNVELEMVLNGWAWVIGRYGPDEAYFDALEDAQTHRRGIWTREDNINPWEFKRQKGLARRKEVACASLSRPTPCPVGNCGGRLIRRSGRFGDFIGCSNFPRCRYSSSIAPS
jgi:micrococcal nuclease